MNELEKKRKQKAERKKKMAEALYQKTRCNKPLKKGGKCQKKHGHIDWTGAHK